MSDKEEAPFEYTFDENWGTDKEKPGPRIRLKAIHGKMTYAVGGQRMTEWETEDLREYHSHIRRKNRSLQRQLDEAKGELYLVEKALQGELPYKAFRAAHSVWVSTVRATGWNRDRAGRCEYPLLSTPDMAVGPDGQASLIWATGTDRLVLEVDASGKEAEAYHYRKGGEIVGDWDIPIGDSDLPELPEGLIETLKRFCTDENRREVTGT